MVKHEKAKNNESMNKVVSLFKYVEELNKLKRRSILNLDDHPWHAYVDEFPAESKNITINYPDSLDNEKYSNKKRNLVEVRKGKYTACPEPSQTFVKWLQPNWNSFKSEVKINNLMSSHDGEEPESFYSDLKRVKDYEQWLVQRNKWAEKEKITEKSNNLFSQLYNLYFELERDSETFELVVANGVLFDKNNELIKHPVLTRRVKLEFNPKTNIISIVDTDVTSELYPDLFQMLENVNLSFINKLQEDLLNNDYHPLDRNDTPMFLKTLIHQLSSNSIYSDSGIPDDWKRNYDFLLVCKPCFILRKRLDGSVKAIEKIIEDVTENEKVPSPILDLVDGGKLEIPEENMDESVEEQLASVGGESVDILLSKEANKEQLEIAKRIEMYNAVLVQGPPGTGKTHTIANLLGHFLAQGKSVLVTSQTTKALKVLKDKVVPGLRDLCVSILEDSNTDMENSINGITEYMSSNTSFKLKKKMNELAVARNKTIQDLASVRSKIFQIIHQECNVIVYDSKEYSPSAIGDFVLKHSEDLSYIPGKVKPNTLLPLTFNELTDLYRSNEAITPEDEKEFENDLPDDNSIILPSEIENLFGNKTIYNNRINDKSSASDWDMTILFDKKKIDFKKSDSHFEMSFPGRESVQKLKEFVSSFEKIDDWMIQAAVDGKNGGGYRDRWITLIKEIENNCNYAGKTVSEEFGKTIDINESSDLKILYSQIEKLKSYLVKKGKLNKLTLLLNKDLAEALQNVTINGDALATTEDCDVILHYIQLKQIRSQCAKYWDTLMGSYGIPAFDNLDPFEPERIASHYIKDIQCYLDWYKTMYNPLIDLMNETGLLTDSVFSSDQLDSDLVVTKKILDAVKKEIPLICDVLLNVLDVEQVDNKINSYVRYLQTDKRASSSLCNKMVTALKAENCEAYAEAFKEMKNVLAKFNLKKIREDYLNRLYDVAPQWADAIRERNGIHGEPDCPGTIEEAWKWKQFSMIIDDLTEQSFSDLQSESIRLSKDYRKITAKYAEICAWYHLLSRTEGDIDMSQALQGWKKTIEKIGKGTGKRAPLMKAKAREAMSKCQRAVPAWIMPINRALETLDPKVNKFDIVIIDEASQSDISSLAILYMGKKLIIVGDDKQVSPMAIGIEQEKIDNLQNIYLNDNIPNAHLFDAKTSIYDIAKTTFRPLMLKEHFRCVPEIIGFSNMLSYNNEIKPLREANDSKLLPAVVNYRVKNGHRESNKTNVEEAKTIVALIKSCIQQPEYNKKTFGIISMLGDNQVKLIQKMLDEQIETSVLFDRKILCGNASNFQGDERDVIFLSLVDSGNEGDVVRLQSFGSDDSIRKRYNVAASRARDQLWVIHSLDSSCQLKPGDIRKTLIDYAKDPSSFEYKEKKIQEKSESPFEYAVATALTARGYHLEQQWKVGAYRLDMVAVCNGKAIAIECDGERYHSGDEKIREDMERQTILERLGWRFIRIRGSEYYSNPEITINRVVNELHDYDIEPESEENISERKKSDLYERVIRGAEENSKFSYSSIQEIPDSETIAAALNPKNIVPEYIPKEKKVLFAKQEKSKPEEIKKKSSTEEKTVEYKYKDSVDKTANNTNQTRDEDKRILKAFSKADVENTIYPDNDKKSTGPESEEKSDEDIVRLLRNYGFLVEDRRDKGGALWVIGGSNISDTMNEISKKGYEFKFTENGGKATHSRPGWWYRKE